MDPAAGSAREPVEIMAASQGRHLLQGPQVVRHCRLRFPSLLDSPGAAHRARREYAGAESSKRAHQRPRHLGLVPAEWSSVYWCSCVYSESMKHGFNGNGDLHLQIKVSREFEASRCAGARMPMCAGIDPRTDVRMFQSCLQAQKTVRPRPHRIDSISIT